MRACLWHTPYTQIKKPPPNGRVCGASHHAFGGWNGLCRLRRLKKKSPSERKVSDGLYFQNQKPEKRVRACGTHPTHKSRNRRSTVGCVAQATHAFSNINANPYSPKFITELSLLPPQSNANKPRRTSRWNEENGHSFTLFTKPCFTGLKYT